ncbi:MAG: hypothetical protein HXK33_04630 [Atopobium sp.]|nr:hypothetical protein [Atopobium sp.]
MSRAFGYLREDATDNNKDANAHKGWNKELLFQRSFCSKKHYGDKKCDAHKDIEKHEHSKTEQIKVCVLKNFAQVPLSKKQIHRKKIKGSHRNTDNPIDIHKRHMTALFTELACCVFLRL